MSNKTGVKWFTTIYSYVVRRSSSKTWHPIDNWSKPVIYRQKFKFLIQDKILGHFPENELVSIQGRENSWQKEIIPRQLAQLIAEFFIRQNFKYQRKFGLVKNRTEIKKWNFGTPSTDAQITIVCTFLRLKRSCLKPSLPKVDSVWSSSFSRLVS